MVLRFLVLLLAKNSNSESVLIHSKDVNSIYQRL